MHELEAALPVLAAARRPFEQPSDVGFSFVGRYQASERSHDVRSSWIVRQSRGPRVGAPVPPSSVTSITAATQMRASPARMATTVRFKPRPYRP